MFKKDVRWAGCVTPAPSRVCFPPARRHTLLRSPFPRVPLLNEAARLTFIIAAPRPPPQFQYSHGRAVPRSELSDDEPEDEIAAEAV